MITRPAGAHPTGLRSFRSPWQCWRWVSFILAVRIGLSSLIGGLAAELLHCPEHHEVVHIEFLGVLVQGLRGVSLNAGLVLMHIKFGLPSAPRLPHVASLILHLLLDIMDRLPDDLCEPGNLRGGVACTEESGNTDPFVLLQGHFAVY